MIIIPSWPWGSQITNKKIKTIVVFDIWNFPPLINSQKGGFIFQWKEGFIFRGQRVPNREAFV